MPGVFGNFVKSLIIKLEDGVSSVQSQAGVFSIQKPRIIALPEGSLRDELLNRQVSLESSISQTSQRVSDLKDKLDEATFGVDLSDADMTKYSLRTQATIDSLARLARSLKAHISRVQQAALANPSSLAASQFARSVARESKMDPGLIRRKGR
jgi:hypothetical protein